ncbi:MAG: hypothetical protein ACI4PX_04880, partial [Ruminococcus sp.]
LKSIKQEGIKGFVKKVKKEMLDENEIIDGIMSFGSAVQVLSPDSVVKKIKEKLLVNYKKIPCLK